MDDENIYCERCKNIMIKKSEDFAEASDHGQNNLEYECQKCGYCVSIGYCNCCGHSWEEWWQNG